jgi:hypothetical protein
VIPVREVRIGKAEGDYVLLHDADGGIRVKFADDSMATKEEWANCFRGLEGKRAAVPVDGRFFIATDFWPGETDGCACAIPVYFPIVSVEHF